MKRRQVIFTYTYFVHMSVVCSCLVAPHIIDPWSSDDVIVEEGDDVKLVCNATGEPPPQVTWRRQATPTSLTLITGNDRASSEDRCQLSDLTTGRVETTHNESTSLITVVILPCNVPSDPSTSVVAPCCYMLSEVNSFLRILLP